MSKGFTLIQLIVGVAILTIIAVAVFVTINPVKRIGEARDTTRLNDVLMIKQALTKYINDNNGSLPFSDTITPNKKVLCSSATSLTCDGDTETCITITDSSFFTDYLNSLPIDPEKTADTDTGYYITRDTNNVIQVGSCTTYGPALAYATTFKDTGLYCGDESCNNGETCATCATDCGACPFCGDEECNGDETCDDCPEDCGVCPSGCEGYEADDLCWFAADNDTQSCTTVCSNNDMTCSATNWNDDTSCTIIKALKPGYCGILCSPTSATYAPYFLTATPIVCLYREVGTDQNCEATGGGYPRICACE